MLGPMWSSIELILVKMDCRIHPFFTQTNRNGDEDIHLGGAQTPRVPLRTIAVDSALNSPPKARGKVRINIFFKLFEVGVGLLKGLSAHG